MFVIVLVLRREGVHLCIQEEEINNNKCQQNNIEKVETKSYRQKRLIYKFVHFVRDILKGIEMKICE